MKLVVLTLANLNYQFLWLSNNLRLVPSAGFAYLIYSSSGNLSD